MKTTTKQTDSFGVKELGNIQIGQLIPSENPKRPWIVVTGIESIEYGPDEEEEMHQYFDQHRILFRPATKEEQKAASAKVKAREAAKEQLRAISREIEKIGDSIFNEADKPDASTVEPIGENIGSLILTTEHVWFTRRSRNPEYDFRVRPTLVWHDSSEHNWKRSTVIGWRVPRTETLAQKIQELRRQLEEVERNLAVAGIGT